MLLVLRVMQLQKDLHGPSLLQFLRGYGTEKSVRKVCHIYVIATTFGLAFTSTYKCDRSSPPLHRKASGMMPTMVIMLACHSGNIDKRDATADMCKRRRVHMPSR